MRSKQAIDALGALAQESRLAVFKLLVRAGEDEMPAGEVARELRVPASTMSTHLAILERAGLIQSRREGRTIFYRADLNGMTDLMTFLIEDCCEGRAELCTPLHTIVQQAACCESSQKKTRRRV
ncbi:MAG: metalloregulator ArsR/SmtB family transcription factor [Hyphomonadaceae bacterium]|nr:metalloregulator ArsR/SmtB family transcription factor [Hyphomonadaceae bacterium]